MTERETIALTPSEKLQAELGDRSNRTPWYKLMICDELLRREEAIKGATKPVESLFRMVPTTRLHEIDCNDTDYTSAIVHGAVLELQNRGRAASAWYLRKDGVNHGPVNRIDLDGLLNKHRGDIELIWKEGWKEWHPLSELKHLQKPYFFIQHLASPEHVAPPQREQSKSTALLIAGIFQFLGLPFWLFFSVLSPFMGFWSFTGPIAPMMFSLFMAALSVPLGIGLVAGAKWAIQTKLATSALSLLWFGSAILIDQKGFFWIALLCYELLMFVLVLSHSSYLKKSSYA